MSVTAQHALKGALSAPRFDFSAKEGRKACNRHVSDLARKAFGVTPTLQELADIREILAMFGAPEEKYAYPLTPAWVVFITVGRRVLGEASWEDDDEYLAAKRGIQALVPYYL